jgi:Replication-relaxation
MTGNKPIGLILQDRDRRLLAELGRMRVVDREQAKLVAGFGSTTRANTRLLALTRAGFLRRFFAGTILGGRKAFYTLSPKAVTLVGSPLGGIRRPTNTTLAGDRFLEHQLRINEIYLNLRHRTIPIPGVRFVRWKGFAATVSANAPIVPDGYFELDSQEGVRAMFLEVDLGTEPLRSWRRKADSYLRLAVSGEFQQIFHQRRFRVLVVAPSSRRLHGIRSTVASLTDKIFWFSTFSSIETTGFWSPVWLRPRDAEGHALIPLCATATTAIG